MRAPCVDVIVVVFNQRELAERCVASAATLNPPPKLFVVDNGDDGSGSALRDRFAGVEVLEPGSNLGFGAAVNLAAARGIGEYILLLNSDAAIDQAAFERLLAAVQGDTRAAGAGPLLRDAAGRLELSVGRTLSLASEIRFRVAGALYGKGHGPVARWLERRATRARRTVSLSASCLLIRREAFAQAQGFDEQFFLYAEDVDLCVRVARAGWHWVYVPEATVTHAVGASGAADRDTTEAHYRSSQMKFYAKHNGSLATAMLRTYLRAKYRLRWLFGDRRRRAAAARVLALLGRDAGAAP